MKALPLLLVAAYFVASAFEAEAQTSTKEPASSNFKGTKKTTGTKKTSSESRESSGATKEATSLPKKETTKPAADTAKTGKTEPAKAPEKKAGSSAKKAGTKSGSPSAKSKSTEKDKTASDAPAAGSATLQKNGLGNEVPSPANAEVIGQPKLKPPQDNAGEDLTRETRKIGPNITLDAADLADFDANPPAVQRLLALGLELTKRNLTYRYGSSDPNSGGMDCSGTIYYLLKTAGVQEPPRDSSGLYLWAEKAGTLRRVTAKNLDDPALDDLKPGDLMFWEGTYEVQRDPPISHTMIYLGREKQTGIRVMVGASDGRVYDSVSRNGVSVFDFRLPRPESTTKFVGYARVPGLENAGERTKR